MHQALAKMMKPVHDRKLSFRLNYLCRLAGTDIKEVPCHNNACLRWILGWCDSEASDPRKCIHRAGNVHLPAAEIPDEYAAKLMAILQPGVDKFMKEKVAKK